MEQVVLVIHLVIAVAMVILVLLQRSEGAGLAGPSGAGMMPVRGSANILTRATGIAATIFFITSITLAIMAGGHRPRSIADEIAADPAMINVPVAPPTADAPVPALPAPPVTP